MNNPNTQAIKAILDGSEAHQPVGKKRSKKNGEDFPAKPTTIQVIKTPRGTMNHSYRDFSQVPPQKGYEHPKEIKDMSFAQKVHHILSNPDNEKWISWMSHGRAFKVHVPVLFETQVCPTYFNHKRYSSFLRELNNHGFKHLSKGQDRNCYYHEFMLKGRPHLAQYMPKRKDARRLVTDPANEPDFYKISNQYPLDLSIDGASTREPAAKRARMDSGFAAAATLFPPVSQVAIPAVTSPLDGINSAAVLMALLEAKHKQEEKQKQQQAVLQTVATLLQGVQQQHSAPPQQIQQAVAQPDASNVQALLAGLLQQMN
eukprot:scaffold23644_cov183-Amphora_coffeaeformis.AAC.4